MSSRARSTAAVKQRPRFLLCPPKHFRVAYEINPWMRLSRQPRSSRARAQWETLVQTLKRLGARVSLLEPSPICPDLVFTANAGLARGKLFIPSRFRFPERRAEEPVYRRFFRSRGYRIADLPEHSFFEGEGDALLVGERIFLGYRFRSEIRAHQALARILRVEVLSLELADRRFYHLDTCLLPLGPKTVLYYPGAFDAYGRRVIRALIEDPLAVSRAEALKFVCNGIAVGRDVVLNEGLSRAMRRALERRGFRLHELDLSEFHKSGGSAKCLVLRL